jgi:thioredoxin-related protein
MKKIFLLNILFIMAIVTYGQDSHQTTTLDSDTITKELRWIKDFEKAQKLAKKKHKPLLVFFTGSDWCGPCRILHKDFLESKEFIELAKKELILYEANFPRRTDLVSPEQKKVNYEIKRKYAIRGYPTILILNSDGVEVARRSGYSKIVGSEYHFDMLKKAINNK